MGGTWGEIFGALPTFVLAFVVLWIVGLELFMCFLTALCIREYWKNRP